MKVTPAQKEVLEIVRDNQDVGIITGITDVARQRGCSYSTARTLVINLIHSGALANTPGKQRSLRITAKGRRWANQGGEA